MEIRKEIDMGSILRTKEEGLLKIIIFRFPRKMTCYPELYRRHVTPNCPDFAWNKKRTLLGDRTFWCIEKNFSRKLIE